MQIVDARKPKTVVSVSGERLFAVELDNEISDAVIPEFGRREAG